MGIMRCSRIHGHAVLFFKRLPRFFGGQTAAEDEFRWSDGWMI